MRTQKGTFGTMQQISKPEDFSKVEKNGFFSMIYAPHEGRLIKFSNFGPYHEPAFLEYRSQDQKIHALYLNDDDFEMPSELYLQELRESEEPSKDLIDLVNLCTELAFTKSPREAYYVLKYIKAFSQAKNIEKEAIALVKIAMNIRRRVVMSL